MLGIVLTALAVWIVLVVLGFVIKGLFWLAVVGIILFFATAAFGWLKRKTNN